VTLGPWLTLLLALPALGCGEALVRRCRPLAAFSIPAPVVGGLLVAALVLALREVGGVVFGFSPGTTLRAWTWLVTTELEWAAGPTKPVHLPFLGVFFACVGLSASWQLVRRAGREVLLFLVPVIALAVLQNLVGVGLSALLGVSPLLGIVCGSLSLTGGHATALGFAGELERAGLEGATALGSAAATLGLLTGALLAGPVGAGLIRRFGLQPPAGPGTGSGTTTAGGVLADTRRIARAGVSALGHLALLVLCLKAGAWLSLALSQTGLAFPVVVGTLVAGAVARNLLDLTGARWFSPDLLGAMASVALGIFLATAMMTLDLQSLAAAAVPMLVIVAVQVAVMAAFACWVTFRVMGRDYEAAVMAAGHSGFGLGSTMTAVAGMKAVVERTGAAPRAFLVVPFVGGFLVDLANALNLTAFITLFRTN
jgi:glutamate:Na+ symporter, ESS family